MNTHKTAQSRTMREQSSAMLSDHIIAGLALERCFRRNDPWVTVLQAVFVTSFSLILLALVMVLYRFLDLPSLPYLWQLIMSLCE